MSEAYEFQSKAELLRALKKKANMLRQWPDLEGGTVEELVERSVGQNTYRGLHYFDPGPKDVFTDWSCQQFQDGVFVQLSEIDDQTIYDGWIERFAERLRAHWPSTQRSRKSINYGQSRKLTNLLLKAYVSWSGCELEQRNRLLRLVHVPLDEFVLVGLRQCVHEYPNFQVSIPATPSMSSVKDKVMYRKIQLALRDIARLVGLCPIHLDVFFWDFNHKN